MDSNKKIISCDNIRYASVINVDLYVKKINNRLVQGIVYDPYGNPVPNAGIEIIEICNSKEYRKTIGCIFTNNNGEYSFTIEMDPFCHYEFKLYSTI